MKQGKIWQAPTAEDQIVHDMHNVFEAGQRNHHISNTAYPIAHNTTWKAYKVKKSSHMDRVAQSFDGLDQFALYSHIPFCETRCYFCEYTVVGKSELDQTKLYMDNLEKELDLYSAILGRRKLQGFDIGGGTPSFVSAELIDRHVNHVSKLFSFTDGFEISIETTPKIAAAEPEKIAAYHAAGIRRISMGIQVTQPDLLKALGREGNGISHISRAVEHIRRANFDSFNIDLMYGFAGQSMQSWEATLNYAISLKPEYITLYRMRYKLTRISSQAYQVEMAQVLEQAALAKALLTMAGYWANPGKNTYSRITDNTGTSAYLTGRVIQGAPYLGVGLGAQTFTDTTISYNSGAVGKNLTPYFKALDKLEFPIQDLYDLPAAHMMAKMVAVSFYFGEVNLAYFENKFGVPFEQAYSAAIKYALDNELMAYTDSKNGIEFEQGTDLTYGKHNSKSFSLTEKGARHFNGTIALFFAPSVQSYLIDSDPLISDDFKKNESAAERIFARG